MIDEKALYVAAEAQLNAHRAARGLPPTRLDQMRPEHRPEWFDESRAAITAYLQALPPSSTGETEGWVLVPKEPTLAMCNAGWREIDQQGFRTEDTEVAPIYRAMLSAAGGER